MPGTITVSRQLPSGFNDNERRQKIVFDRLATPTGSDPFLARACRP
jgi:hypothetical protein